MFQIIHYPEDMQLPDPWEIEWGTSRSGYHDAIRLPLARAYGATLYRIARATEGTPIPAGCYLHGHTPPEVEAQTRRLLKEAAHLLPVEMTHEKLAKALEDCPQILAPFAPPKMAPEDAIAAYCDAEAYVASPETCACVRAAPKGYSAYTGIGSTLWCVGIFDTYEEAENAAVGGVMENRQLAAPSIARCLEGFLPTTPFCEGTKATWMEKTPITVRRGPLFAKTAGSSWDLPVVAMYEGSTLRERSSEPLGWDDEEERQKWHARNKDGQSRAQASQRRAVDAFASDPRTAPYIYKNVGMQKGSTFDIGEYKVELIGPVRMAGETPQALGILYGGKSWIALLDLLPQRKATQ